MTTNISLIHENVFLIIQDNVQKKCLLSLYKRVHYDNKHFLIHENVFFIIRYNV